MYLIAAMWFSFLSGSFVHHLVRGERNNDAPTAVYHIGVDYYGKTVSTCQERNADWQEIQGGR